mmetsp:Transcript_48240/g.82921  ORF Transcript_48240/g.82921 Transcript_48240/m.82921 type:complete len:109 (-) Transcript_48240:406-732(-)
MYKHTKNQFCCGDRGRGPSTILFFVSSPKRKYRELISIRSFKFNVKILLVIVIVTHHQVEGEDGSIKNTRSAPPPCGFPFLLLQQDTVKIDQKTLHANIHTLVMQQLH